MHVLTVIDHANPGSFTHAVAARFADGARAAGHEVEVADLHAEGFDPRWQPGDDAQFENAPMPADVLIEQARIARSDALALVFPLWWWGMPAMMKGWVDRVFSWGWAYNQTADPRPEASLLRPRACAVLVPAGASPDSMAEHGFDRAIETAWLTGTLGYMGLTTPALHVLHGSTGKPERRAAHLETAYRAGLTLAPPGGSHAG